MAFKDGETVPSHAGVTVVAAAAPKPSLRFIEQGGSAHALVWPGMGAQWRSLHHIRLEAGGRTVVLEHDSEAVYFVMAGEAAIVDGNTGEEILLPEGSMPHITAGHPYRLVAVTTTEIVGGPCPPDLSLYEHLESADTPTGSAR